MAKAGTVLTNPYAETVVFRETTRDTAGALLEVEGIFRPGSAWPPEHYHPKQTEFFEIIAGRVQVRCDGQLVTYGTREHFTILPGVVHSFRNASNESEARVIWRIWPALKTELFFETLWGLANDRKTDVHGVPGFLQVLVLAEEYADEFRLAQPPYVIQRIAYALLAPVGRLLGYRGQYPKYSGSDARLSIGHLR